MSALKVRSCVGGEGAQLCRREGARLTATNNKMRQ